MGNSGSVHNLYHDAVNSELNINISENHSHSPERRRRRLTNKYLMQQQRSAAASSHNGQHLEWTMSLPLTSSISAANGFVDDDDDELSVHPQHYKVLPQLSERNLKLRSTANGSILHAGGTISGGARKSYEVVANKNDIDKQQQQQQKQLPITLKQRSFIYDSTRNNSQTTAVYQKEQQQQQQQQQQQKQTAHKTFRRAQTLMDFNYQQQHERNADMARHSARYRGINCDAAAATAGVSDLLDAPTAAAGVALRNIKVNKYNKKTKAPPAPIMAATRTTTKAVPMATGSSSRDRSRTPNSGQGLPTHGRLEPNFKPDQELATTTIAPATTTPTTTQAQISKKTSSSVVVAPACGTTASSGAKNLAVTRKHPNTTKQLSLKSQAAANAKFPQQQRQQSQQCQSVSLKSTLAPAAAAEAEATVTNNQSVATTIVSSSRVRSRASNSGQELPTQGLRGNPNTKSKNIANTKAATTTTTATNKQFTSNSKNKIVSNAQCSPSTAPLLTLQKQQQPLPPPPTTKKFQRAHTQLYCSLESKHYNDNNVQMCTSNSYKREKSSDAILLHRQRENSAIAAEQRYIANSSNNNNNNNNNMDSTQKAHNNNNSNNKQYMSKRNMTNVATRNSSGNKAIVAAAAATTTTTNASDIALENLIVNMNNSCHKHQQAPNMTQLKKRSFYFGMNATTTTTDKTAAPATAAMKYAVNTAMHETVVMCQARQTTIDIGDNSNVGDDIDSDSDGGESNNILRCSRSNNTLVATVATSNISNDNIIANIFDAADASNEQSIIDNGLAVHMRPTLPRRQLETPLFSPATAWRTLPNEQQLLRQKQQKHQEATMHFKSAPKMAQIQRQHLQRGEFATLSLMATSVDVNAIDDQAVVEPPIEISQTNKKEEKYEQKQQQEPQQQKVAAWIPLHDLEDDDANDDDDVDGEVNDADTDVGGFHADYRHDLDITSDSNAKKIPKSQNLNVNKMVTAPHDNNGHQKSTAATVAMHMFSLSLPRDVHSSSMQHLATTQTTNKQAAAALLGFSSLQKLKYNNNNYRVNSAQKRQQQGVATVNDGAAIKKSSYTNDNWVLYKSEASNFAGAVSATLAATVTTTAASAAAASTTTTTAAANCESLSVSGIASLSYLTAGKHLMYLPPDRDAAQAKHKKNLISTTGAGAVALAPAAVTASKSSKALLYQEPQKHATKKNIHHAVAQQSLQDDTPIFMMSTPLTASAELLNMHNTQNKRATMVTTNTNAAMPKNTSPNNDKQQLQRFSFQSTMRLLEKKRVADKASKDAEIREAQRKTELEAMKRVEEDFQRKRSIEKAHIRRQLHLYFNDNSDRCDIFYENHAADNINENQNVDGKFMLNISAQMMSDANDLKPYRVQYGNQNQQQPQQHQQQPQQQIQASPRHDANNNILCRAEPDGAVSSPSPPP